MILFPNLDPDDATKLNEVIARELKVELMECETPTGEYDFRLLEHRFPSWPWIEDRAKCNQALPRIALMATDAYEHELSSFHQFIVYRSLEAWRDITHDLDGDAKSDEEHHEREEHRQLLEYFLGEAFEDEDFLTVDTYANAVLHGTDLMDEMGVAIEDFFEVMPADIRRDIERHLAAKAGGAKPGPSGNDDDAATTGQA